MNNRQKGDKIRKIIKCGIKQNIGVTVTPFLLFGSFN